MQAALLTRPFPDVLVSAAARQRLLMRAQGLPPIWESVGLECRLDGSADLLAAVIPGPMAVGEPADLTRRRQDPNLACFSRMWFEWDDAGDGTPFTWWGCVDEVWSPTAPPPQAAGHCAARLGMRAEGITVVERVATALQPRGRVLAMAHLGKRGIDRWRMFMSVERGQIRQVLSQIGWKGDHAQVIDAWFKAVPLFEPGFLQLEVDQELGAYLAIEAQETNRQFSNRIHRQAWLETLVAQGLISKAQADATLAWPSLTDDQWEHRFHLKHTLFPGPPSVKVYLALV
jgi:hypothetical protein